MNVAGWLLAVLVLELIAIVLVAYLSFSGFFDGMRIVAKIGIWMMTTGLMVQIMRSLHYFEFGAYPVDTIFPLWVTKDIGASLIVFDLFLLSKKR
jgi:hypothetical protein